MPVRIASKVTAVHNLPPTSMKRGKRTPGTAPPALCSDGIVSAMAMLQQCLTQNIVPGSRLYDSTTGFLAGPTTAPETD